MKPSYAVFLLLLAAPVFIASHSGVAEIQGVDRTGAPGSSQPCGQCHSAGAFNPTLNIELLSGPDFIPVTEYVGGETYQVRFTINAGVGMPSTYGFQATAVFDSDVANAGTFSNPGPSVQLEDVEGRHIVEQSTDTPSNTFEVSWTAPESGSGPLTFYASAVASNNNMNVLGDGYDGASLSITEQVTSTPTVQRSLGLSWRLESGRIRIEVPEEGVIYVYATDGRILEVVENVMEGETVWLNTGKEQAVLVYMKGKSDVYSAKIVSLK
jgi:hypothetical protein